MLACVRVGACCRAGAPWLVYKRRALEVDGRRAQDAAANVQGCSAIRLRQRLRPSPMPATTHAACCASSACYSATASPATTAKANRNSPGRRRGQYRRQTHRSAEGVHTAAGFRAKEQRWPRRPAILRRPRSCSRRLAAGATPACGAVARVFAEGGAGNRRPEFFLGVVWCGAVSEPVGRWGFGRRQVTGSRRQPRRNFVNGSCCPH